MTTTDTTEQPVDGIDPAALAAGYAAMSTPTAAVPAIPDPTPSAAPVALPDPPGGDLERALSPDEHELGSMVRQAQFYAMAEACPKALRSKPADVLLVLMTGRALNIAPTVALAQVRVIQGTPAIAPQLMAALVRRSGKGRVTPVGTVDAGATEATARAERWDGPGGEVEVYEATFTIVDAERAGLIKSDGAWETYPGNLCYWRAVAKVCREFLADLFMGGAYTHEELGLPTDAAGNVLDVDAWDVPDLSPMTERQRKQDAATAEARAAAAAPALPEQRAEVERRIARLPQAARADLGQWWTAKIGAPVAELPARKLSTARAKVDQVEKVTLEGNYGPDAAAALRAAIDADDATIDADAVEARDPGPGAPDVEFVSVDVVEGGADDHEPHGAAQPTLLDGDPDAAPM